MINIPVIDLASSPKPMKVSGRSSFIIFLWSAVELVFVTNPWQISSKLRISILRLFGADIGRHVIFRPRTRVKFPWKLHIGDSCWIGEGVWFHNQDEIFISNDVVISQESFLTTGSHAYRTNMELITRPIVIESGVWITSRCVVLGGAIVSQSCISKPLSVLSGYFPPNSVISGSEGKILGLRFS